MNVAHTRRPSSIPPATPVPPPSTPRQSRRHEDLVGASGSAVRFRPARLSGGEVPFDLRCRFRCDGGEVGPLPVLDLSSTGFGAGAAEAPVAALTPGTSLEAFELLLEGTPIWAGEAVVVHGTEERLGGRFTSGVVDLERLRLGATLEGRLAAHREQRERLPAAWRAAVADLRRLLEDVQLELDEAEQAERHDPMRRVLEEAQLFETLRVRWGSQYLAAIEELHVFSAGLDERAREAGRAYATSMLMPLLAACPLQRRAFEKPLGYAGDYRMMELCFVQALSGDSLFGRFLHSMAQSYTLVRAVVAREAVMREAARKAIEAPGTGPVRILALAAGPSLELRRLLEEVTSLSRPVELILLDQDPSAHEAAHCQLTRILLERHRGMLPVTVRCLHFSVRQLIRPVGPQELDVRSSLSQLDLVYSAGLYDYLSDPVASRLTQILHSLVRPGGRVLVGNLVETPDSTWIMEYVLGWRLHYRDEGTMMALGAHLSPSPRHLGVVMDATGRCLFLDVIRAGSGPRLASAASAAPESA
jgi:extracellular factor (EF) 3-hydroxypalmitic acid methyl ester biosynthesis protein